MALLADTALWGSSRDMAPSADSREGRPEATVGSSEKALASLEGQGLDAWKCVLRPWYGLQVCMQRTPAPLVTKAEGCGGGEGGGGGREPSGTGGCGEGREAHPAAAQHKDKENMLTLKRDTVTTCGLR